MKQFGAYPDTHPAYPTNPQLQRPDLGIETVSHADPILVSDEQFPWLNSSVMEVPTVSVKLSGLDTTFRYGSIVDGNGSVEKIARDVPSQASSNAEMGMFKGLEMVLKRQMAPNLEFVVGLDTGLPVYKTTKRGPDAARLYVAMLKDDSGEPVVLKLAIAQHKKQEQLYSLLRSGSTRRKKDGYRQNGEA
jgi:hypothetical protein